MKKSIFSGVMLLTAAIIISGCTKKEEQASAPATETAPAAQTAAAPQTTGSTAQTASKGVGPVTEVKIEAKIDAAMADKGKAAFEAKCTACHKIGERYVGPAITGVTKRRQPEWIMNMILNPAEMLQKDDVAKELLGEYLTPMTFQNVSQDEARQILEYFRQQDSK